MKFLKFIILIISLLVFTNCRSEGPKYIFLITLDTTRADAVNYEPGNESTPHLAALASQGTRFTNAYANIPITLPSHASMFYSLYPHDLKIYNNGQTNNSKYPSLAQLFKSRGFTTGAVISLGVLKRDFGLDRGFDFYYENFSPGVWTRTAEQVNKDLFKLINETEGEKSFIWAHYSDPHEPYFPPYFDGIFEIFSGEKKIFSINNSVFPIVKTEILLKPGVNTIVLRSVLPSQINLDPLLQITGITYSDLNLLPSEPDHTLIIFPDNLTKKKKNKNDYFSTDLKSEFKVINKKKSESSIKISFLYKLTEKKESRRKLYFESVKYMDDQIGKLTHFLKEKRILDKSVILVIGDHGEGLGEHWDHYGHIHFLNKVYTHVPFILYGKGIHKGKIRRDLVSNLDVATTLLEIAGIKQPKFMLGAALHSEKGKDKLILETFSPEAFFDAFSLIEKNNQILFYPGRRNHRVEFSDLIADPLGTTRKKKDVPEKVRAKLLKSILNISRTITATKGKVGKKKRIHEDILRSLGYL